MGRVSDKAKIVAVALLNFADDEGFFIADPAIVKSDTLPYDNSVNVPGILRELSDAEWIVIHNHPKQGRIGHITTFLEHQKISHPKPSKLKQYWEDGTFTEHSRNVHGTFTEASPPEQGSGIRDQGRDLDSGTSTLVPKVKTDVPTQEDLLPSLSPTDLTSEKKTKRSKAAQESKSGQTWEAYSTAYAKRYGVPPTRNAKISKQLCTLVEYAGADLAPKIAAYYLTSDNQWYVTKGHAVDYLLSDWQKLRTEYLTGNRTTQAQARELDRRQGEGDGWRGVIERRGE